MICDIVKWTEISVTRITLSMRRLKGISPNKFLWMRKAWMGSMAYVKRELIWDHWGICFTWIVSLGDIGGRQISLQAKLMEWGGTWGESKCLPDSLSLFIVTGCSLKIWGHFEIRKKTKQNRLPKEVPILVAWLLGDEETVQVFKRGKKCRENDGKGCTSHHAHRVLQRL